MLYRHHLSKGAFTVLFATAANTETGESLICRDLLGCQAIAVGINFDRDLTTALQTQPLVCFDDVNMYSCWFGKPKKSNVQTHASPRSCVLCLAQYQINPLGRLLPSFLLHMSNALTKCNSILPLNPQDIVEVMVLESFLISFNWLLRLIMWE